MAVLRENQAPRPAGGGASLHLGDLRREGDRLVLEAQQQARAIVEQARAERERLLAGARAEGLEAGRREGHAEGLAQGLRDGHERAIAEGQQRLAALDSAWQAALAEFKAQQDRLQAESREDLITLALAIASRVVQREIVSRPEVVADQAQAVIRLAGRAARLTLHVNPEDVEIVSRALPGMAGLIGGTAGVELRPDPAVSRGSCVAHTPRSGVVDATIQTQLDRIAAAIVPGAEGAA